MILQVSTGGTFQNDVEAVGVENDVQEVDDVGVPQRLQAIQPGVQQTATGGISGRGACAQSSTDAEGRACMTASSLRIWSTSRMLRKRAASTTFTATVPGVPASCPACMRTNAALH